MRLTAVFAFLLITSFRATAGLTWIDVGVNGLTCSLCSRSVEKSILQLPFIDRVEMNLEDTEGRLYLKSDATVDFKQIARAVEKAGFSVRFMTATFSFDDMVISENGSFYFQDNLFQWIGYQSALVKGAIELKLLDEDYLPRREADEWQKKFNDPERTGNQPIIHVVRES